MKPRSPSPAARRTLPVHTKRRTGRPRPKSNYELFNCNNLNIRYWSWNYRGCWPIKYRVFFYVLCVCCEHFLSKETHNHPLEPLQNGCYCSKHPLSSDGFSTSLMPPRERERQIPFRALRWLFAWISPNDASSPRD